jgi:mannose-6-phosphate isomerase-like protein (cupin superfamily)
MPQSALGAAFSESQKASDAAAEKPQQKFDEVYSDPWNSIFHVVFYPDRIYHAAYLNATRSGRYRYNVREVRNAFDITVLKGEVYLDGVFLSNVLRVEYRGGRLTEVAREKNRTLGSQLRMYVRLLKGDADEGPHADLVLHYDKWINAYQTEIWESVAAPPRKHHDFRVLDQIGRMGPITTIYEFKDLLRDVKSIRRVELAFREADLDRPSGARIDAPEWDNNYLRSHQVPNVRKPSSSENTVLDRNYLIDFRRGYYFDNIRDLEPVRYENAMMDGGNSEARAGNVIEMRWIVQREFSSSMVFFHEVTVPPGAVEGTHRHIGTEELYCITEGEGVAYLGDGDDPSTDKFPLIDREVMGYDRRQCRELPVKPGSVIFTKSGGIHGIRNNSADKPLRFVAFLYHTA